jgi:hypothetical protein
MMSLDGQTSGLIAFLHNRYDRYISPLRPLGSATGKIETMLTLRHVA